MKDIFRDAPIGQFIRLFSTKYLRYPDEEEAPADPEKGNSEIWQRYRDVQKTRNVRYHGECEDPEQGDSQEDKDKGNTSEGGDQGQEGNGNARPLTGRQSSDRTRVSGGDEVDRDMGGIDVDAVIDWDQREAINDPEVCLGPSKHSMQSVQQSGLQSRI